MFLDPRCQVVRELLPLEAWRLQGGAEGVLDAHARYDPQLERAVIKDRANRLRAKADEALQRHLDGMIGRVSAALVEKPGFARAGNFAGIRIPEAQVPRAGALVDIDVTGHDGRELQGVIAG